MNLLRDKSGVISIEFALLGPLFFAIILSYFETGWLMTKSVMLDQAVATAARDIYTGQVPTKEALEASICEKAIVFSECEENVNVEAFVISNFSDLPADTAECLSSSDESFTPSVKYNSGLGGSIVFLRVCVTTDVIMPGIGLGSAMKKTSEGRLRMVSSTAFMNEPFS